MEINRLSVFLSPLNFRTLIKQQRNFKRRTWQTKFYSSKALKDDMFVKKGVKVLFSWRCLKKRFKVVSCTDKKVSEKVIKISFSL